MDEATRMQMLLNHLKVNALQFSKLTGISQPSVSAITLGKKRITIEIVHRIIETYPLVNIDWLLKGTGEMFIEMPEEQEQTASEPMVEYHAIKSTISPLKDGFPDEEKMKTVIAENLRIAGKRWKFTQSEMLELLGGGVGKGGASTYFRGDTLPRLPLLLRLERLTGWSLAVLSNRVLSFDEIPPDPLIGAPIFPAQITEAENAEMMAELHRLQMRIARIIEKYTREK